jgi:hypothetical protein
VLRRVECGAFRLGHTVRRPINLWSRN